MPLLGEHRRAINRPLIGSGVSGQPIRWAAFGAGSNIIRLPSGCGAVLPGAVQLV